MKKAFILLLSIQGIFYQLCAMQPAITMNYDIKQRYEKYAETYIAEYAKNNPKALLRGLDPSGKHIQSILKKEDATNDDLKELWKELTLEFVTKLISLVVEKAPSLKDSCLSGDIPEVDALLSAVFPHYPLVVNFPLDEDGCAALHFAIMLKHIRLISMLIEHGAIIDIRDMRGFTPLHYASIKNNAAPARALLNLGATVDIINNVNTTPLHLAHT
jgi:hypothetical protein